MVLSATGGGQRHALIVEHQLRPLFGFFEALTVPTAIYASGSDFAEGTVVSDAIRSRVARAASEAIRALGTAQPTPHPAAEPGQAEWVVFS